MSLLIDRKDCVLSTPRVTLDGHVIFNPSIFSFQDQLLCSFRACTGEKKPGGAFDYCIPPNREFYNEIILGRIDDQLNVGECLLIDTRSFRAQLGKAPCGFEDCRPFSIDGQTLEAVASVANEPAIIKDDGMVTFSEKVVVQIGKLSFDSSFSPQDLTLYESPMKSRVEKNWCAFNHEGELHYVYLWDPVVVLRPQPDGSLDVVKWFGETSSLDSYRGSSQGIPYGDGHLFVVHRRFHANGRIYFVHKLVELGPDLAPRRVSDEMHFLCPDILEYCAGLTSAGGRIIFSIGINDVGACLISINQSTVEELLKPIAPPDAITNPEGELAAIITEKQARTFTSRITRKMTSLRQQAEAKRRYQR